MTILAKIFGRSDGFDKNTKIVVSLPESSQTIFTVEQALTYMTANKRYYDLMDMMLYNIPIRDVIREKGIDYVADKLLGIAPSERGLTAKMDEIVRKFREIKLADFDIQMLPVSAPLHFFGQSITYRDLMRCCEITRRIGSWTSMRERENECLHVVNLYVPYPCFDSYDYANETRNYENFFISNQPFTEEDCIEMEKLPHAYNYRYVVEDIPSKYLPIVYRDGDNRYMFVATAKDNPQITAKDLAKTQVENEMV